MLVCFCFFFSSRRRHTRCALVTGVQTCALPIFGELKIDVAIAFGVNDEFEGSNAQRLAAALVAAEKSIRTRALWTKYTPRQKEDAGWQLSFHSQLEDALAGGDIWVAFQPQYEIAIRRVVGVEALARWTHTTRGPIQADQFLVHAEQSQDHYRLTLFRMGAGESGV